MADLILTTTSELNGSSITITVYEDVGDDGSGGGSTDPNGKPYDNSAVQVLSGGTDEENTLTGFDASAGNAIWVQIDMGDPSVATEDSPAVDSIEVSTSTPQSDRAIDVSGRAAVSTGRAISVP